VDCESIAAKVAISAISKLHVVNIGSYVYAIIISKKKKKKKKKKRKKNADT